jgi:hypothetical protein
MKERIRIESQKTVAAHLAKLWGRSVSAPTVSYYAHPEREDRLPLEWDPIGISWIWQHKLEKWAKRQKPRAAPKRKRATSRR